MLAISAALTTIVYNRVWETWMPKEPVHVETHHLMQVISNAGDFAEKTNRFVEPKLDASLSRVAVVLPDGRLWLRRGHIEVVRIRDHGQYYFGTVAAGPWREGFVPGRNWRNVVVSDQACFAIQSDGSLWDLSQWEAGDEGRNLKRFSDSADWKSLAGGDEHFLALKTDGTIWQWGRDTFTSGTKSR